MPLRSARPQVGPGFARRRSRRLRDHSGRAVTQRHQISRKVTKNAVFASDFLVYVHRCPRPETNTKQSYWHDRPDTDLESRTYYLIFTISISQKAPKARFVPIRHDHPSARGRRLGNHPQNVTPSFILGYSFRLAAMAQKPCRPARPDGKRLHDLAVPRWRTCSEDAPI